MSSTRKPVAVVVGAKSKGPDGWPNTKAGHRQRA